MNEKDPNGKLPQAPVLSPETVEPYRKRTTTSSDEVSPSQVSSKNNRGTKILIGSCATLLLAGAVTTVVLTRPGVFSKAKNQATEEPAITVSSETTSASTEPSDGSNTDPTTTGPHVSVVSLSQITDKQYKIMDEAARDFIREDGNTKEDGIPDQVDIDGMYCLGMIRQEINEGIDRADEKDIIQMVYQVQLTDRTGDEPVKRQYYWMCGFSNVFQDGTVQLVRQEGMWSTLCFDNWSAQGCLDLNLLLNEAEYRYPVRENGVDSSLIQPFAGEDKEQHALIGSLDQITEPMETAYEKACGQWFQLGQITVGAMADGVKVENIEYAGLVFAISSNKANNRVYVVYKFDVADLTQTPPVRRSVYWYACFEALYEGGQIQTRASISGEYDVITLRDWVNGPATIEELRTFIKEQEYLDWTFEDNLDKDPDSHT